MTKVDILFIFTGSSQNTYQCDTTGKYIVQRTVNQLLTECRKFSEFGMTGIMLNYTAITTIQRLTS